MSIIYHIPDSRLNLLNGNDFYLWWRDSVNQSSFKSFYTTPRLRVVQSLSEGLNEVDCQMARKLTVDRQKRNIFTVNRQMNKPIIVVKCLVYPYLAGK